jgi:hypothetical protein
MAQPPLNREDVQSALEARRELGSDYDPQVIDAFLEKVDARIDERLKERRPAEPRPIPLILPLGSLGIGIGATGAALGPTHGGAGGIIVAIVAWIAIAVVNIAYAATRR